MNYMDKMLAEDFAKGPGDTPLTSLAVFSPARARRGLGGELARRGGRAGDRWPSGDRALELGGGWQQHPASNQRRNPSGADSRSQILHRLYPFARRARSRSRLSSTISF